MSCYKIIIIAVLASLSNALLEASMRATDKPQSAGYIVVGLKNFKTEDCCFLNALLQCFYHSPQLTKTLLEAPDVIYNRLSLAAPYQQFVKGYPQPSNTLQGHIKDYLSLPNEIIVLIKNYATSEVVAPHNADILCEILQQQGYDYATAPNHYPATIILSRLLWGINEIARTNVPQTCALH